MTTAMKLFNGIGVILYTNSSKNIITDEDHAKLDLQNQGFVFKDQQMQKQFTRNKLERIKKHLKDLTSCFEANHSMTYEIGSIAPFSDTPDSHIILESAKECASCRKTEGIGNLKSFWMADATSENNTTGIAGKICNGYLADNNAAQEHADKNSIGIPLQIIMRRDESVQTLKRGKQKMYHAPGMIVGCAGSGKTSLLKRLQGITVKEIENNIQSTRGVDVFIDMFDVTDTIHDDEQQSRRILSILDFAGQCAYYASHQIFLNRWSFFLIMMKDMDDVIGKEVCCQEGSVYKCWKFRDKFLTSKEELKPAADFGEMSETPEDDVGFPHVLYHKSSPDSYTEEEDHSNEPADMLMEYDHSHRLRRTSAATELWMQTELDVCYVDLYDSDDDLDIILEDTDYDIPFNVESPTETEDSYRRTGRRHQDSVIIIISEEFTSQKQHILSGGPSLCTEGHSLEDELSLNHHTFWNLMSSVDQERKRKVFCDSELSSKSYLDSGYLDSDDSLQSSEYQKDPEDFDLKNPFHVSEQVVRWEDGISAQNVETEMVNVNLVVENITKNFNTTVQEELCKDSNEKSKGNIKFAEKMPDVMENDKPLLGVTLCALLVNLCVIAAVFAQSGVEVMKYSENTKMQNKKASNKQMLQTSRREKRKKQRILRDIINWQISLRRNTTVMYDSHALNCRRIYPSTSDGPTALQQIANETGVDEAGENVNQSMRGEVNPNNQTQGVAPVNGFADVNQVTHPRDGNLPLGRYGGRDVESRFFSNPVMGAERPTDCDPLSRSMPAQLHSNNVQTSEGTLPAIAEGENVPSHLSDNNSVQATEERECHVTALEGSTFSLAPELDGPSLTSTDTLSDLFTSLSLSSVEGDEAFRYEWIRLKTFSEWPLNSLFSTVLARAGWVSLGEGDRARCYSCHIVHDGWRTGDNPRHFHDQNCRFLGDSSDNIPITRETPDPATRRTLMTDLERAQQTTGLERAQQTTGLRSPGIADNAPERPQASETGNTTTNLMSQDNRPQETRAIAMAINNQGFPRANTESPPVAASRHDTTPQLPPDQPVYTTAGTPPNSSSREAQLEALRRDPMGINFERPKYPSYAILAVRISSYTDWPAAMTQTPRDMALAGFFYAGYGDYTRCFFCGGGLRNWEAGDDPWVEHARWFSKCAFVRQNRGQQFIDLVLRRAAEVEEQRQLEEAGVTQTNVQTGDPATTQAKEDKIMKSAAVTSIRDMGYEDETIKAAITKIKSRLPKGKHKVSAQEILEVIFELADSQRATETLNNQSQSPDLVDQSETVNERATSNPSQSNSTTERINQSTNEEAAAREASNTGACNSEETETNSLPNPTFDELTSLRHENTSLKDQILCKICMEKNVSIAFLPCGHLACCVDCAPAMRKCPICREFVRGTVKTFLV